LVGLLEPQRKPFLWEVLFPLLDVFHGLMPNLQLYGNQIDTVQIKPTILYLS